MSIGWVQIVQWLHILAGITWFGSYIFITFALWPAMFRRPAAEAKAFMDALAGPIGALMAGSGMLVIILGFIRGTLLGPIRSFDVLFNTPYGLTWLASLILAIILSVYGATESRRIPETVWDGDQFKPGAKQKIQRNNIISLFLFSLILACMVLMRFGM